MDEALEPLIGLLHVDGGGVWWGGGKGVGEAGGAVGTKMLHLAGTDTQTHTHTQKQLSHGGCPRHTPRKRTRQALDLTAGAEGLGRGVEESCIDFCVCCFGLFVCFFYSVNQI